MHTRSLVSTILMTAALLLNCLPASAASRAPALAWQFDVHAQLSATPVVAGNQLFVGAEDGNLYALDLASRKLQWLFHSRAGIASRPAVDGGMVYFLSRDGRFQALDAASGAPVWQFRTQGESRFAAHGMFGQPQAQEPVTDPWDFFLSSPLVVNGKVYFGSSDERVYALDARSGAVAWVFKTGGVVHSSPSAAGDAILVGSWDGALYALDAATGKQKWRFQTETEQQQSVMLGIQASPVADADTVYVGSRDGYFYALDLRSGALKWRHNANGAWVAASAVVDDSKVYFGTSDSGLFMALDKATGKPVFSAETQVWTFAAPLLAGDAVIGATVKGEAFALDRTSGKRLWTYRTPEGLADEYRIIDSASGKFDTARMYGKAPHQLDSALEHVKRLGAFLAAPVWHDGQLILTTSTGRVMVFE